MLGALARTLRPAQWPKNVFVLAPLFLAQKLGEPAAVRASVVAFVAFCLASSAVYIINDIRDRDEDSRHPLKKHRPIASGDLSPVLAAALAVVLLVATAALARPLGSTFALLVGVYVALNLLYSSGLKRVVILDVMILSVGFVLRVAGGAAAIRVEVSSWLFLCTIFLALFLAFSKRRHELVLLREAASDQRHVLIQYSQTFLDQMINVVTASCVISYALYATDPATVAKVGTNNLVLTVPLVLFGIFRYLYLVYQKTDDRSPTEVLLRDAPFLVNVVLWGLAVLWIVYGGGGAFSTLE
jgi:4-hydroxybenzoate polyprenyltransferase